MSTPKVPLLDLNFQNGPLKAAMMEVIGRIVDENRFILGPEVDEMEKECAAYCGTAYSVGVSSGTDALLVALMALDVSPGDEIITTPYTFFATAGAIHRMGAVPVFVDIDPVTWNIDVAQMEAAVSPKTVGILPVHLYGQCADMDGILKIAEKHGLWVLEDAAQAIGAKDKGRPAGSMGQMGAFSFFPSKNLGCLGDGGLVSMNDEGLYRRVHKLRGHGMDPKYYHSLVGGNFRIDAIQAAVIRLKLPHLDEWTKARQDNAADYLKKFQEAGVPAENLRLPTIPPDGPTRHIVNQFIISTPRRDALKDHLLAAGIGVEVYYPVPLHLQECFTFLGYEVGSMPGSEKAALETLALPIFPGLNQEQRDFVVEQVVSFLK